MFPSRSEILRLVEKLDILWRECEDILNKNSEEYQIKRYEIERVKRMINPVGKLRCYQKSNYPYKPYLICQFRYIENGESKSKNFPKELYNVIKEMLEKGSELSEILKVIKNN